MALCMVQASNFDRLSWRTICGKGGLPMAAMVDLGGPSMTATLDPVINFGAPSVAQQYTLHVFKLWLHGL